mmetsp:Transcript_21226/g.35736  ORF Transcript_21226/g.35736 Transcript_21226/m.35736 type:complete len:207 (+) Transcript_21226:221-841(+)
MKYIAGSKSNSCSFSLSLFPSIFFILAIKCLSNSTASFFFITPATSDTNPTTNAATTTSGSSSGGDGQGICGSNGGAHVVKGLRVVDGGRHGGVGIAFEKGLDGAAQRFARPCLGESGNYQAAAERCHRPNLLAHSLHGLPRHQTRFVGRHPLIQHHQPNRDLSLEVVCHPHHCALRHQGVALEHLFDLSGGEAVASSVHHIVGPR